MCTKLEQVFEQFKQHAERVFEPDAQARRRGVRSERLTDLASSRCDPERADTPESNRCLKLRPHQG